MPGLFGPTPGEIQASRGDRRLNRLSQFGQIPLGTLGGGMAGLLAGEAFQDATGGSPELKQATLLQEVFQKRSDFMLQHLAGVGRDDEVIRVPHQMNLMRPLMTKRIS